MPRRHRSVEVETLVDIMQGAIATGRGFKSWGVARRERGRTVLVAAFATKRSAEHNCERDEVIVKLSCVPLAVYR